MQSPPSICICISKTFLFVIIAPFYCYPLLVQKNVFKKIPKLFCSSLFLKLFVLASKLTHPIFLEKGWLCATWGYDLQQGYISPTLLYFMMLLFHHSGTHLTSLMHCALPFFFPSPPTPPKFLFSLVCSKQQITHKRPKLVTHHVMCKFGLRVVEGI